MTGSESELLAAVRATSEETRARRVLMQEAAAARAQAVQAAMEAGIAREKIAQAAGVHRNLLYRLTKDTQN